MTRKLNNAHLRDIADTVDPSGTTGAKMLNNEYLERIANGIGSITGIVDPGTGKIDSSMLEGVIDASNLPSYVDDVIEGYYHQSAFYSDSAHANAITGETGKIYVDVPSGATYRWGGSAYAKVGGPDVEIATTQDAVTGTNDTKVMTPLKTKQAIDASGVPEMSPDVRGGAKLDADGGLALRDGALGVGSLVQESEGTVRGGIASLTAKGHAEQASTTGKNLAQPTVWSSTSNGVQYDVNADGSIRAHGTASGTSTRNVTPMKSFSAGTYVVSGCPSGGSAGTYYLVVQAQSYNVLARDFGDGMTFTLTDETTLFVMITVINGVQIDKTFYPQLELGSTATEYEPYSGGVASPSPAWPQEIVTVTGHAITGKTGRYVDLEVRQGSTLLSTTPIPLPQRGWVGSLPDGTADVLRLDGAGKVEWVRATEEAVATSSQGWTQSDAGTTNDRFSLNLNGAGLSACKKNVNLVSHGTPSFVNSATWGHMDIRSIGWFVFNNADHVIQSVADFKTWLATHPVTVLYPLATPVTEVAGYIDMPSIAGDAVISIPELDELGVRYFVDDAVLEYGRQIYERVRGEYAGRLSDLEAAVAEIVAGA